MVATLTKMNTSWNQSLQWRLISRAAALANQPLLRALPRCGAKCRSKGMPCEAMPVAGRKRCFQHGGATPKGDQWHRIQWPDGKSPSAERKLAIKLDALRHRERLRQRRLAGMTDAERAAYEQWRKYMHPGTAAEREARKADRRAAKEMQLAMTRKQPLADSRELAALRQTAAEIDVVRANLETARAELSGDDLGVFG